MMRDMRLYVQDILESLEVIEEYIKSFTEKNFIRIAKFRTQF